MPGMNKHQKRQAPQPTEFMRKTNDEVSVIQDRKLQQAGFEEALRQGQEHLAKKCGERP